MEVPADHAIQDDRDQLVGGEIRAGRAAVALLVGAVLVGWNQMWIPKLPATGELGLVLIKINRQ